MKKSLLFSFLLALVFPFAAKAQNPDAIYIATWVHMSDLGNAITPSDSDPVLTYNSATGCYEGVVVDWPKAISNPYNAKIPYSVSDGEITYYGVAGASTQSFTFNNSPSTTFDFTASTNPSLFKGFALGMGNNTSIATVDVSVNLTKKEITFTKSDSGLGTELPYLVSVSPANGSLVTPAADGSVTVTLAFSGTVTSMVVSSEDKSIKATGSNEGKLWTIVVPEDAIKESAAENGGNLVLKIEKVYANDLPINFNGKAALGLSYPVEGITNMVTFIFDGTLEAVNSLKVYKSPDYMAGNEIEFYDNKLEVTYLTSTTYLFTAGSGYTVSISSTVESEDDANWETGTGVVDNVGANGNDTGQVIGTGPTVTLYKGANGAVFTIKVTGVDAGVESIATEDGKFNVYSISGSKVYSGNDASVVNALTPGIYIVNGKKILVK